MFDHTFEFTQNLLKDEKMQHLDKFYNCTFLYIDYPVTQYISVHTWFITVNLIPLGHVRTCISLDISFNLSYELYFYRSSPIPDCQILHGCEFAWQEVFGKKHAARLMQYTKPLLGLPWLKNLPLCWIFILKKMNSSLWTFFARHYNLGI